MPIYEYLCRGCQHRFEVKQRISDPPIDRCERCGQPVEKLISAPGIMFKGSGWYVTDYSNKLKPPSESSAGGTEKGGAEKSTGGSADAKPAAKDGAAASPAAPAPAAAPSGSSSPSSGSTTSSSSSSPSSS